MAKHNLDSLQNLPSNSDKSREEKRRNEEKKKEITPVINQPATRRKQSMGKKFADTFLSESIDDVKTYVIFDVLVPRITDAFLDMVNEGLNMLFKGSPRSSRSSSSSGGYKPRVSYTSYYDEPKQQSKYAYTRRRDSYSFDDLIVGSRGEAEKVIDRMIDILEQFDVVTVSDLYQIVGLSTVPEDSNYGWTNLDHASTKRVNGGYLLDLPRVKVIRD